VKGHATENDFVIIDDRDGQLDLSPALVRALCDRNSGIGADGVLRVVRAALEPEAAEQADAAPYFMDYRNADGSVAEMCGNGARLFLRYLQQAGLAGEQSAIATRGGARRVWSEPDGSITVEMGPAEVLEARPQVQARNAKSARTSTAIQVPNPHVVVLIASEQELAELDLSGPPVVEPPLPFGQNVEFVVALGPRHLRMRVHERGVGETRSCGTGICAVVVACAGLDGVGGADGTLWQVDVPGGTCFVRWRADGELVLTGPAVIVADAQLSDQWLATADA
jgi:diaminopimelate epimerase